MIETFRKIWQFAGKETKNINQSVAVGFLNAILQMFQVAAIYFIVLALTDGKQGGKTAWLALGCELIAIFVVLILIFDWRLGLVALIGILLYLCVVSAMEKKSASIAADTQQSQTALIEAVLETVQGMSVIKSFNLTGKGDQKLQHALEYNRSSNLKVEQVLTPYTALQEAVLQIASVGMMLAAVLLWHQRIGQT